MYVLRLPMYTDPRLTLELPDKTSTVRVVLELARFVAKRTRESIDAKRLIRVARLAAQAKVTSLQYTEEGIIGSWGATHQFVQKADWQWVFAKESTRAAIPTEAEFIRCRDVLTDRFPAWKQGFDYLLQNFAAYVESQIADGANDDELIDTAAIFISDLSHEPCDITVAARLTGVTLANDSPLQIGIATLRRVRASDMELEHTLGPIITELTPMAWRITPSAVVEFRTTGTSANTAQEELSSFLNCLCLFRLGSVRYIDFEYRLRSVIRPSSVVEANRNFAPPYRYMLQQSDAASFAAFVEIIRPLLPAAKEKKPTPAQIAFNRFTDALLRAETIDSRITSAITCLEALFLRDRERSELTHKLGLRCAALMRILGKDPLDVKKQLTRAYDIRSTYIHGGLVDVTKGDQLDELCNELLQLARVSVQAFLQLEPIIKKDDFLGELDKSLLSADAVTNVQKTLSSVTICD